MEYAGTQLSWPQSQARQAADDRDAEAEARAKQQRRKVQNRKNQRAHRLRLKGRDPENVQESRPFQVRRWRLDEPDHFPSQEISLASERATTTSFSLRPPHTYTGTSPSTAKRTVVLRGSPSTAHTPALHLDPQPFTFPLSSDHLLHLIQYNVCRALISNMRTLNTQPAHSTICTISSPCRDDTALYPLKPDIPPSLVPTALQQTRYHSTWINVIPFPRARDNLIRYEGRFDPWELMQDLVGDLINSTPAPRRRDAPVSTNVPETQQPLTLSSRSDPDEVTAGRKGLIVWGEPHEMKSWEATPGFLAKWGWIVDGCDELVEISNHWRMKRGEEPMRLAMSRSSYPPPPLSHAAPSGG
ncbi:hypothetical protein Asppvi_011385 [Aspergillus pseudoviridinutans]|uniref:BZIP domain-containing protein n=1 Tax=Aspergillus pseudoviridinutans TaxID=1517512 RepID=A0A9P3BQ12_9EURO|nr:uncharacterized protein Asppvi_011385 [Aspergillus pseudoviridinutans]GIJ92403.1 hypothetical protein Asppvi_011385 [Aspergillus pseudoviridinutans]